MLFVKKKIFDNKKESCRERGGGGGDIEGKRPWCSSSFIA